MGFALAAAPFWNSSKLYSFCKDLHKLMLLIDIKKFDYWGNKENANTLGTTKDSVNSMVSNGITISKDAIDA